MSATFVTPGRFGGGALDVVLGGASRGLSVSIDDTLVVDHAFARRAHVDSIPPGPARVHVAVGGGCEASRIYDRRVDIIAGATVAIPLPAPEPNTACMVGQGLSSIALMLELVATAVLLDSAVHHHVRT
ncbi:MAG TPA: hypothetical protein VGM88_06595 [Kofleriaceae bacterium]